MTKTTITLELDTVDAERLPHLLAIYTHAMGAPPPDAFNDMVPWAYNRQAAQAELARFCAKILAQAAAP